MQYTIQNIQYKGTTYIAQRLARSEPLGSFRFTRFETHSPGTFSRVTQHFKCSR